MKKRLLSVVLALTMVIGSFNVVFAEEREEVFVDESYAYAYAYAECNAYTGFASTSLYVTDEVTSMSSSVSAKLYIDTSSVVDNDSESSGSLGTLNVSVELSYYISEAFKVSSSHSVRINGGALIRKSLDAYR